MDESMADTRATRQPCLLCGAPLFRQTRPGAGWSGRSLSCARCESKWEERTGATRHHGWWLVFGTASVFALTMICIALRVAAGSVCIEVVTDGTARCVDAPPHSASIRSPGTYAMSTWAGFYAVIVIPALVGLVTANKIWWKLVLVALGVGNFAGFAAGRWYAHRTYPEMFWKDPELAANVIGVAILLFLLSGFVCLVVTMAVVSQPGALTLEQVYPDLKEGNHGAFDRSSARRRLVPEFYDPVPDAPRPGDGP